MKVRILAVFLAVASISSFNQAAEAGALTDALRNKLGQASFLGNVAKAKIKDGVRGVGQKAFMFLWRHS